MDYARIYCEFIADRRAKEGALEGYTERHHILPRCLGGSDEAQNLINLTPEDHFFAHLLLAKAHGGKLWAPIAFMVSGQRKDYRPIKSRRAYGWVAQAMARAMSGEGAHQFDHTIYRLEHVDGRKWQGRQADMPELGFSRAMANLLIKSKVGAAKGWYLEGCKPVWTKAGGRPGHLHYKADQAEHRFCHVDGREFIGTRIDFRKFSGVGPAATTGLIDGSRTISKGWHLHGVTPKKNGRAGAYAR